MKKSSVIACGLVTILWLGLVLGAWFGPKADVSLSERRPLAQMPDISATTLLNGKFMSDFEKFTLDQFPLRDTFRSIKALFSRYALRQQDNNNIYVSQGHAAEQSATLDESSLDHALRQFQKVYTLHLNDSNRIFSCIVPDKGYYLAPVSGHLSMDYGLLFETVRQQMPWAEHIDITGALTLDSYYRTDTHWKQEAVLPVAQQLGAALGVNIPQDFTQSLLKQDFYGVYYGQAALPMVPDELYVLENDVLENCRVYDYTAGVYRPVYDLDRLTGNDPYEVFLSGAQSLLRIENPNAPTDRELILFRDSFASSLAPLLVQDYAAVTLIDIRYIQPELLGKYVDFQGADVLFLHSTLVLNKNLI